MARSKRRRVSRNRTIALLRRQKVQDRLGLRSLLPQPGSRLGQLLREDQKDHQEKLTARKREGENERDRQRTKTVMLTLRVLLLKLRYNSKFALCRNFSIRLFSNHEERVCLVFIFKIRFHIYQSLLLNCRKSV